MAEAKTEPKPLLPALQPFYQAVIPLARAFLPLGRASVSRHLCFGGS
jgi:hypothetical protein